MGLSTRNGKFNFPQQPAPFSVAWVRERSEKMSRRLVNMLYNRTNDKNKKTTVLSDATGRDHNNTKPGESAEKDVQIFTAFRKRAAHDLQKGQQRRSAPVR